MIKRCTGKFADWLIRFGVIDEGSKDLYEYAIYSILITAAPIVFSIAFGLIFRCPGRSVLIILPFMVIRKFSGGFHTKKSWTCILGSGFLLVVCVLVTYVCEGSPIILALSYGSAISLICFSPLDSSNRILDNEEKRTCKKITEILVILCILIISVLFILKQYTVFTCLSVGLMLAAGLQIPVVLKGLSKGE